MTRIEEITARFSVFLDGRATAPILPADVAYLLRVANCAKRLTDYAIPNSNEIDNALLIRLCRLQHQINDTYTGAE